MIPCDQHLADLREYNRKALEHARQVAEEHEAAILAAQVNGVMRSVPEADATPAFIDRITSALRAAASKALQPPPSVEAQLARLDVCRGCTAFEPVDGPAVGYCGACGCGRHPFAGLAYKATIARSACPKRLWDAPSETT